MATPRPPFIIVNEKTGWQEIRCSCCSHPHLLYVRKERVIEFRCRQGKQTYTITLETTPKLS